MNSDFPSFLEADFSTLCAHGVLSVRDAERVRDAEWGRDAERVLNGVKGALKGRRGVRGHRIV